MVMFFCLLLYVFFLPSAIFVQNTKCNLTIKHIPEQMECTYACDKSYTLKKQSMNKIYFHNLPLIDEKLVRSGFPSNIFV